MVRRAGSGKHAGRGRIRPRPFLLATTHDLDGRPRIITIGVQVVIGFQIIFIVFRPIINPDTLILGKPYKSLLSFGRIVAGFRYLLENLICGLAQLLKELSGLFHVQIMIRHDTYLLVKNGPASVYIARARGMVKGLTF